MYKYIVEDEVIFDDADIVLELTDICVAAEFMTDIYCAFISDTSASRDWRYFSEDCMNVLSDYDLQEMYNKRLEVYKENDFYLHKAYCQVLENNCNGKNIPNNMHRAYQRIFVKGKGDYHFSIFYIKDEYDEKHIYYIKESDSRGNKLATYYYDFDGNVVGVINEKDTATYYFGDSIPLNEDYEYEQCEDVLYYAEWIRDIAFSEEYINGDTLKGLRMCLE